jgi:hypothetical protein
MLAASLAAAALYASSTGAATSNADPTTGGLSNQPDLSVGRSQLEQVVRGMYDTHPREPVSSVACDGPLAAKLGATQRCAVTLAGKTYRGVVIVDTVKPGWVHFHARFNGPDSDH